MEKIKTIRLKDDVHRKILLERAINPQFSKVQDLAEAATLKGLELIRKEREADHECLQDTK